jgi:hypothetical protein
MTEGSCSSGRIGGDSGSKDRALLAGSSSYTAGIWIGSDSGGIMSGSSSGTSLVKKRSGVVTVSQNEFMIYFYFKLKY